MDAGFISHLAAAAAFAVLTLLLLVSWRGRGAGTLLIVASVTTMVWAALAAYFALGNVAETGGLFSTPVRVLEVLRSAAWIALLWGILTISLRRAGAARVPRVGPLITAGLCLVVLALDVYPDLARILRLPCEGTACAVFGRLGVAVIGLALAENLYRNTESERRWSIKHLCFAVAGMFVYDIFLYADAILVRALDYELLEVRGITNALIVPLIAVSAARNREWRLDIFVSRRVVFHSAALIGTGVYMLLMAGVGYYLREFGGSWGAMLRMAFLFGAAILLPIILSSGRLRSRLKVLLTKHFFTYKYDYREEWLNFIRTISSATPGRSLRDQTIRAIANIVDSPDGGLWLRGDADRFDLTTTWNFAWPAVEEPADGAFARFLEERQWVVNLNDSARSDKAQTGPPVPEWLRGLSRAWLVLPLVHEERLFGFIVLGQPRAPRRLNWEDYDLLKTVGRQAASYLAQEQATRALAEARQFEAFNQRFAFVLHDVKNLVSQLSLMAKNAAKHRDNPAFQEDMVRTVDESVEKMNRLLQRLHADSASSPRSVVELAGLLRRIVDERAGTAPSVIFDDGGATLAVAVDEDRLAAVVEHLIQNALDASPPAARVRVRLFASGDDAIIEVEDSGAGMDAEFIREELFRPFKTTKGAGYGIGAFESREFARRMGGRLDVFSEPGEGTTMRLILPVVKGSPETTGDRRKVTA
ncbi:MAG: XrtA/PEP-CTERM system histidine kinase PrsK [Alphaproteobacteria bacterium]